MKKIGVFLLTLAACLTFTACGSKKGSTTTVPPATTQGGGGEAEEKTITTASYAQVAQALGDKFYLRANIPFPDEDSGRFFMFDGELAVDRTGDAAKYAIVSEDLGGMYMIENSETDFISYIYDEIVGGYTYVSIDSKEDTEDVINGEISGALSVACGLTIKYRTVEDYSLFGRACKKYQNTYTKDNAQITEEYVVDNATGLCLSHTKVSSANPGVYIEDGTTFVVAEFSLTTGVDSCFSGQDSRIEVEFWDTEFFKELALDDKSGFYVDIADIYDHYTGTKPTIKMDYASVEFDEDGTGGHKSSHTTRLILGGTDQVNDDFADYIIESIYNCGAKCDATGTERDLSDLMDMNPCTFDAYANQSAQYHVSITYESIDGVFEISLNNDFYIPHTEQRVYKQYDMDTILAKISDGYKIDVNIPYYVDATETFISVPASIAYLNGSIIMSDPTGYQYLIRIDNNSYHYYYIDAEHPTEKYNYGGEKASVDDGYESIDSIIRGELAIACGLTINYTSKENNVTHTGRICTKFILESDIPGGNETEEWYIDSITGICLEHTKTSGQTSVIDPTTFEVTGFALNSSTATPVTEFFTAENAKLPD